MTTREALHAAETELREACVRSAGVDSSILLAHALGDTLAHLPTRLSEPLADEVHASFRALVARRLIREPLAYIVGDTEFMGLRFKCDERAFVPRPDTELLVEAALRALAPGWNGKPVETPPALIADVGTGAGCIAVSLAHYLPCARLLATDASREALALARENAVLNDVERRVRFLHGPDLAPLYAAGRAEELTALVANPPYVPTDDVVKLEPEVSEREPLIALDGGADGLGFYRRTLPQLAQLPALRLVAFEFGYAQDEALLGLVGRHLEGWEARILHDLADLPRVVVASRGA